MLAHGRELLCTALLHTNTAPTFLESPYFRKYIDFISSGDHSAPSRYLHMQTVKDIASRCKVHIKDMLQKAVSFSIEEDSWSRDGIRFSAVTAGVVLLLLSVCAVIVTINTLTPLRGKIVCKQNYWYRWNFRTQNTQTVLIYAGGPGNRFFLGACAEGREGPKSAQVVAGEVHKIVLESLGYNPHLDPDDPSLPVGKVCNMTSDTTNVMPSAAKLLSSDYTLFKDMEWTPCSCHSLNLFLVHQPRNFKSIKDVIARGTFLVTIFRNSAPRKVLQR